MFMGFFGIPFLLIVAVVLLVLAGKSEDDPQRERPASLYLSALTLVGVVLLLAGTFLAVHGLVELTDTKPSGGWSYSIEVGPRGQLREPPDWDDIRRGFRGGVNHDDDVAQLIGGLIVGAIGVALIRFHLPKLQELADNSNGPGARVYSRMLYVVSGVTMLTALAAAGSGLYAIFGMIAPDTAGAGEVTDALRSLITAVVVASVAAALFRETWTKVEDLAALARPSVGFAAAPATTETVVTETPAKKVTRVRKAAPPKE